MNLREKIDKDFVSARKEKNDSVVSALGMLRAAILNQEISLRPKELTEDDILKVVRSEVKKRKDSITEYEKGKRDDLASKEKEEVDILSNYLPKEMEESELREIIKKQIKESGATGASDFGKVMGLVMKATAGRASGEMVQKIVKESLLEK